MIAIRARAELNALLQTVLTEMKRRGVTRVAGLYAAGAWGLLQIADIVFPLIGLPDWSLEVVLLMAAVGFPFLLCFAWFYDLSPEGLQLTAPSGAAADASGLSPWRLLEFALIAILVVIVGVLYLERLAAPAAETDAAGNPTGPVAVSERSVAVLPFEDMSTRSEDAYLGDGLAEEILNLLARIPDLRVAARTSSFRYRDDQVDVREIGAALSVRYVLEGSVRRQGDRIRVTAQFIDANTGYHLWSDTFDRDLSDIFVLQDDVAMRVVNSLHLLIDPDADVRDAIPSTTSSEAYQAYLRGRDVLRRHGGHTDSQSARALFEQALESDPAFASAWAGLCESYLMEYRDTRESSLFEAAEKSCHRALTLDNSALPVYVALGHLYLASGQIERARSEFESAISRSPNLVGAHLGLARSLEAAGDDQRALSAYHRALDFWPNSPEVRSRLASYYFRSGQSAEAIREYAVAIELDPGNADLYNGIGAAWYLVGDYARAAQAWKESIALRPTAHAYSNTATSYYYLGRFDEAIAMYSEALRLTPADFELLGALGDCYRASGRNSEAAAYYREAIAIAEEVTRINPGETGVFALMAHYYAAMGDTDGALAIMKRIPADQPLDMYVHYDLALANAAMGNTERALLALDRAVAEGYPRSLLTVDPGFAALQQHDEFMALLEQR